MFTASSGCAMDQLINRVTEVVATQMTDALLESYNSDEVSKWQPKQYLCEANACHG
jgi:hypothetical protein